MSLNVSKMSHTIYFFLWKKVFQRRASEPEKIIGRCYKFPRESKALNIIEKPNGEHRPAFLYT